MITLTETTLIAAPIARVFDLALSIDVHLVHNVHSGEQAIALEGSKTSGILTLDDTVTWSGRHFFVRQRLTARITGYTPPVYFQDTMLRSAFRSMQHDHHFAALPNGITEMRDIFRFAAPIPILGRIAEALVLRRYMQALLHERNSVIQQIAESPTEAWKQYITPS